MARYRRGLIVGKFSPLHKGHEFLINRATEACSEVVILSYSSPEFPDCEAARREEWLRSLFPDARVVVVTREAVRAELGLEMPANDADDLLQRRFLCELWEKSVNEPLNAIFTSENYGDGFAQFFSEYFRKKGWPNVRHEMVDLERKNIPVSGVELRRNVHGARKMLSPKVYSSFVRTVCFIGGESTGKSTLAEVLAERYQTKSVAEYGRTLWEAKHGQLVFEDLLTIARTHTQMEENARLESNRYLLVDSSPLTTLLYGDWLFGRTDDELLRLAERKYDHTFLCAPDFPFVQDGTRQGEVFRDMQHERYLTELKSRGMKFVLLTGDLEERVRKVTEALDASADNF